MASSSHRPPARGHHPACTALLCRRPRHSIGCARAAAVWSVSVGWTWVHGSHQQARAHRQEGITRPCRRQVPTTPLAATWLRLTCVPSPCS
eukprot:5826076-Prymnesium_polylepis.1